MKIRKLFTYTIILLFIAASAFSGDYGDVDDDNQITIVDALLIARVYVGFDPLTFPLLFIEERADVDENGSINIVDALLVARYYVGLINVFPVEQQEQEIQLLSSSLPRETQVDLNPGELEVVSEGNNIFAFDLYHQIKASNDNIFFSPVSISFAFGMCYAGARGSSEVQIADTMRFSLTQGRLHPALNSLELTLTTPPENPDPDKGENLILKIANSSWGQRDYPFLPGFLDILAVNYGAGMNLVDFITDPDGSRLLINDWVAENTEQRIKDLIPPGIIDPNTRLVLTNAIYFKANWLNQFDVEDTTDGIFYNLNNSAATVPMMFQEKIRTFYCEEPGQYQAVELPYQGEKQNSMIIIKPASGTFSEFEQSLTKEKYESIKDLLAEYWVDLTMPRFSFEWEGSLKDSLITLGMTDPFVWGVADLSGMDGTRDLYIGNVMHKSFVAVDEKGTEASAVTAIIVEWLSLLPEAALILDRPFIFVIQNGDTGAILFMGKVTAL